MYGTDITEQNTWYYIWLQKIIKIPFFNPIFLIFFCFLCCCVFLAEGKSNYRKKGLNVMHKLGK